MKHSVPAVFTVLTGITLVTSAAGVVKVAGNVNSFKPKVPEIKTVEAALKEDSDLLKISPSPKVTKAVSVKEESKDSVTISPTTVHNSVKPSVSVQGDDEKESDDQNKKEDVNNNKSNNNESSHAKLELDNDTEVSHQDGQLNLNTGVQIQTN